MSLERKAQLDLVLAVRLTPELNHQLKNMETQFGLKRSAVIRMILSAVDDRLFASPMPIARFTVGGHQFEIYEKLNTTATQTQDLVRALMSHGEILVKDRRSARKEQVARLR